MNNQTDYTDLKEAKRNLWQKQIIQVAARMFKKKGYYCTTMEDIAGQLNITKGSLYNYFKNKEVILFHCHMLPVHMMKTAFDSVKNKKLKPPEKLHAVLYHFLLELLEKSQGSVLLRGMEALSPSLLDKVISKRDEVERGIRIIIEMGMKSGEFRAGDSKLLSFAILGSLHWIPKWHNPNGEKSAEEISLIFADYLVAGLCKK